jgi:hypothetical protein
MAHMSLLLKGSEDEKPLLEVLRRFVQNRASHKLLDNQNSTMGDDLKKLRKAAVGKFRTCCHILELK